MTTTYEIDQAIQAIREDFDAKVRAAKRNTDLSPAGRNKAVLAAKAERAAAIKSYVAPLRKMAVEGALKVKKLQMALGALKRNEDEGWEFARLQYEATSCRSAVALAGDDPFKLSLEWEKVKASGDAHRQKAWADTLPSLTPSKTAHASTWDELLNDIAANQAVLHGAEAEKYEQERRNLLDGLAEVARTTGTIADELSEGSMGKQRSVMNKVWSGIALDRESNQLITELGPVENESVDTSLERLQVEELEATAKQAEVFEQFGVPYDPILDSAPETEGVAEVEPETEET